jgi:hypothetical protein
MLLLPIKDFIFF